MFSYYYVSFAECIFRIHLALSVQVLNLSTGNEEIVDPENVWNGIPDWACRSSEVRWCGNRLGRTITISLNCDSSSVTMRTGRQSSINLNLCIDANH